MPRKRQAVEDVDQFDDEIDDSAFGATAQDGSINWLEEIEKSQTDKSYAITFNNDALSSGIEMVGGVMMTAKGLDPTTCQNLSIETWKNVGRILLMAENAIPWSIGDWLVIGESQFEHGEIAQVAEDLEFEPQTFYDYKSTAKQVGYNLRRVELSFNHHRAVAPDRVTDKDYELQHAINEKLGVKPFREYLKEKYPPESDKGSEPTKPKKYQAVFEAMVGNRDVFIEAFNSASEEDRPRMKKLAIEYLRGWQKFVDEI